MNVDQIKATINEYASIKARISDLREEELRLREELLSLGMSEIDSDQHRVVIVETTKTITDWFAVATHFKPSRQLIQAHTKTTDPTFTVRLYGRKSV